MSTGMILASQTLSLAEATAALDLADQKPSTNRNLNAKRKANELSTIPAAPTPAPTASRRISSKGDHTSDT